MLLNDSTGIGDLGDRAEAVGVIEERRAAFFHYQRLVDSRSMGVSSYNVIAAVEFKQDVFVVEDESGHLGVAFEFLKRKVKVPFLAFGKLRGSYLKISLRAM